MAVTDIDVERRARELADQDWTIEVQRTETGGYFAKVVELPGCMTQADTWDELKEMIRDVLVLWLASAIEHDDPIPSPASDGRYSGKMLVRTSPRLHRLIARAAEREGVSMNQWVVETLATAAGER